ncbi:MAG: hypothetical protein GX050_02230 [Firmicutes bacterium]|nr:hypothetical protein [Bacillota bacterium]
MNPSLNLPAMFSTHRLLKGMLVEGNDGQVVLKTEQGTVPVQLEGLAVPFGREIIFQVIREEPGKIVLSPYHVESLTEKLPFLKDLFGENQQAALEVLQALTNENLPLTREIFADIKRWMLTAEKVWGVKVHPQVFAFLRAKELPINPQTALWALYALFPFVQQELWGMTEEGQQLAQRWLEVWRGKQTPVPPRGDAARAEALTDEVAARIVEFLTGLRKAVKKPFALSSSGREEEPTLRQAVSFLEMHARHDLSLPHFLFYLFSADGQPQVRWEGRGDQAGKAEPSGGFSFRLIFQSPTLGTVEIIGAKNPEGLQLKVRAESSLALQRLTALQPYLENKGWLISNFQFESGPADDHRERFIPLQVDGWL